MNFWDSSAFWLHIHSLSIYYRSWEYDMEKSFSKCCPFMSLKEYFQREWKVHDFSFSNGFQSLTCSSGTYRDLRFLYNAKPRTTTWAYLYHMEKHSNRMSNVAREVWLHVFNTKTKVSYWLNGWIIIRKRYRLRLWKIIILKLNGIKHKWLNIWLVMSERCHTHCTHATIFSTLLLNIHHNSLLSISLVPMIKSLDSLLYC